MSQPDPLSPFLSRWQKATGGERANHQLFITELRRLTMKQQTLFHFPG